MEEITSKFAIDTLKLMIAYCVKHSEADNNMLRAWGNAVNTLEKRIVTLDEKTNGDIILSMFETAQIYGSDDEKIILCIDNNYYQKFDKKWWNSPYEEKDVIKNEDKYIKHIYQVKYGYVDAPEEEVIKTFSSKEKAEKYKVEVENSDDFKNNCYHRVFVDKFVVE